MGATVIHDAIVLMVVLPMVAGIVGLVTRRSPRLQRALVGGLLGLCAVSGVWMLRQLDPGGEFVSFVGNWPPPYAITIVFDALSGVLMTVSACVGLCCIVNSYGERGDAFGLSWLPPLIAMLIFGVNFSFLTGDLFNLFVAFEIMLMASYALALRNATPEGVKQAHKYVVVNLFASAMFVLAAGMTYGVTGTLNLADLAGYLDRTPDVPVAFGAAGVMLLFVFTLKAALFPLWFWLPDTYHTMPAAVGGVFAALLSKVGMYAVIRVIPATFGGLESLPLDEILWVMAGLTMLLGGLCALGVPTLRRVMSFVLIAHMGYALFMVSLGTPGSYAAAGFLLAQEMFVIAGLYTVGAACVRHAGTDDLRRIAELHREMPTLAWLALVLTVAGAGLPPTAAFVAKAWIVQEGVRAEAWTLLALMLVSALLMLLALVRAWAAAFWRLRASTPEMAVARRGSARWATASCALLVLGVIVMSVRADVLHALMVDAGQRIASPDRDLGGVYTPPEPKKTTGEKERHP
ncbi:MAG: Na+/H+ antiporter subunit D [Phycisphaerales bacterium]